MNATHEQLAVMIGTLQIGNLELRNQVASQQAEIVRLTEAMENLRGIHDTPAGETGGYRGGGDAGVHAPHDDAAPA